LKKAAILRAEGDAEAAKLINDSILKSGRGLIVVRKIEAAQHIAKALSSSPNVHFLPSNSMQVPDSKITRLL